jgi:DNA modification methylase
VLPALAFGVDCSNKGGRLMESLIGKKEKEMTKCLNDFVAVAGDGYTVFHGSNLDVLPFMADNSVDSIDPPYELGFMGKKWDSTGIAYSVELWQECLRVLKPGGHILAFGGSRTWHRLAVAIEDAGFELRDSIAWLYGSGFPKSLDVSKAIDKAAGAEREVAVETVTDLFGERQERKEKPAFGIGANGEAFGGHAEGAMFREDTGPATDDAKKWAGWGTALKPAFEPVVVGRKPLIGTVAENVLTWGVGGLNIDGSRIEGGERPLILSSNRTSNNTFGNGLNGSKNGGTFSQGRWPANLILDEYTAGLLDEQSGYLHGSGNKTDSKIGKGEIYNNSSYAISYTGRATRDYGDSGGASRFFYVAKASKRDRNEGLDGLEGKEPTQTYGDGMNTATKVRTQTQLVEGVTREKVKNFHPTVKPTDLMRYLIKLVTPEGGTVLDPFTGSGSTGKAALLDGYQFVGIELTDEYLPIIDGRLKWAKEQQEAVTDLQEKEKKETLF